jgi:excisionase family DNA binding protein
MFLGELEEIRCTATVRLGAPMRGQSSQAERLLNVEQAAQRLGVSKDYLYRHRNGFPFTRRMGRKLLFSSSGIDLHIRQQDGLPLKRHSSML